MPRAAGDPAGGPGSPAKGEPRSSTRWGPAGFASGSLPTGLALGTLLSAHRTEPLLDPASSPGGHPPGGIAALVAQPNFAPRGPADRIQMPQERSVRLAKTWGAPGGHRASADGCSLGQLEDGHAAGQGATPRGLMRGGSRAVSPWRISGGLPAMSWWDSPEGTPPAILWWRGWRPAVQSRTLASDMHTLS